VLSDAEGVVRKALPEGTSVREGQTLVEVTQLTPDAMRKRTRYEQLESQYGGTPDYARLIEQARLDYERAAKARSLSIVAAPRDGIVSKMLVRLGQTVHHGSEVVRLASGVHLVVVAGSVEGNSVDCKAILLDRHGRGALPDADSALVLSGKLQPFPPNAQTRSLSIEHIPAGMQMGPIGKVRVLCNE
jgi:biotin carboxyl carrier protein